MSTMWLALREDWLLVAVRVLGVVLGVWGAGLAAPKAARAVALRVASAFRGAGMRLSSLGASIVRQVFRRPQSQTVYPVSIDSKVGVSDAVTVTVDEAASVWSPEVNGQIEILRARTENLATGLQQLRADHAQQLADLQAILHAVSEEHAEALAAWRADQERREQEAIQINARALPLIGASIALCGLPDAVARYPLTGGLMIAAGMVVLLAVVLPRRP